MKTQAKLIRRLSVAALSLLFAATAPCAGGASEIYLSGSSKSSAGDYVVTGSDEVYHFQGKEYTVYNVYYDNPKHNMKIAVLEEGPCRTYIAYTKDFWLMYSCTWDGFGVRKAMFSSPSVRDTFDAHEFHDQTILVRERKIERDHAVGLIAAYMPMLQA
jgi:hypothetical protein